MKWCSSVSHSTYKYPSNLSAVNLYYAGVGLNPNKVQRLEGNLHFLGGDSQCDGHDTSYHRAGHSSPRTPEIENKSHGVETIGGKAFCSQQSQCFLGYR